MAIDKRPLENLRDCVKRAFYKGCSRGYAFRKMRHAIIFELKRLGYESSEIKDLLLEWNKKNERPYKMGEEKRQILRYVDWYESKECKMGCNALKDFCLGEERCQFYKETTFFKRQQTQELPFKLEDLKKFLTDRYKPEGYLMVCIVQALRRYQIEKVTGEIILVGHRTIASIIRDAFGHTVNPMYVWRKFNLLIDEGVIEIVIRGKSGQFRNLANGYRFLPWQPPENNHNNPY